MYSLSHPHPTIRERDPLFMAPTQLKFQYLTQQMKSTSSSAGVSAIDGGSATKRPYGEIIGGGTQLLLQSQSQHANNHRYIIGVSAFENAHLARQNFRLKIELDGMIKENQNLNDSIIQLNEIVKDSKITTEKYNINMKTNNHYELKYFELKEDERKLLQTIEVSQNNTMKIIERYNKLIMEHRELNIKCNELSLKTADIQNVHSESLEKYKKLSTDYDLGLEKIKELENEKDFLLAKHNENQYIKENLDKLKISFAELRTELESIRMERDNIQKNIAIREIEINRLVQEKIEKIQLDYNKKLLEFKCDKNHYDQNNDLSTKNLDSRDEIEIVKSQLIKETEMNNNNPDECNDVGEYLPPQTKKQKLNTVEFIEVPDGNLKTSSGLNDESDGERRNLEYRTIDSDSIGFFNRSQTYSPASDGSKTIEENAANFCEKN